MSELTVTLTGDDAVELAQALDLLRDWLHADRHRLDTSLRQHLGGDHYTAADLHGDLSRFIDTLGALP